MRAAVAVLPEPYREVVSLRFFGDLSLEEIARQTDRPLSHGQDPSPARTAPTAGNGRTRRERMIGRGGRFDPSELRDLDAEPAEPRATDAELADALAIARELDALACR